MQQVSSTGSQICDRFFDRVAHLQQVFRQGRKFATGPFEGGRKFATGLFDGVAHLQQVFSTGLQICNRFFDRVAHLLQGFRQGRNFATGPFDGVANLQQVCSTGSQICNRSVRGGGKFATGFSRGSQICNRSVRGGRKFATGLFDGVAHLQQVCSQGSQICNNAVEILFKEATKFTRSHRARDGAGAWTMASLWCRAGARAPAARPLRESKNLLFRRAPSHREGSRGGGVRRTGATRGNPQRARGASRGFCATAPRARQSGSGGLAPIGHASSGANARCRQRRQAGLVFV